MRKKYPNFRGNWTGIVYWNKLKLGLLVVLILSIIRIIASFLD